MTKFSARFSTTNRALHDRAHLAMEFPQANDRVIRTYIPFLENPIISETGRSRLNSYNLVGRNGTVFSYAGAESRKFSLTFHFSLLHVMEMDTKEGIVDKFKRQFRLFFTNRQTQKEAFKLQKGDLGQDEIRRNVFNLDADKDLIASTKKFDFNIQDQGGQGRDHAQNQRDYYKKVAQIITNQPPADEKTFSTSNGLGAGGLVTGDDLFEIDLSAPNDLDRFVETDYGQVNEYLDLIQVWLNLIRGSVLNRSDNTTYGPPIVRLTQGAMYSNIPCLVEDYSISVIEEAGYEVQTLTPKRIQVVMNLVESRTGDYGDYVAGDPIAGDNLTGWESIISNNELDPYNGLTSEGVNDLASL